tara:strand:+ start:36 stop:983 length:948 start_codon:yes stop_codon:yes gene_type:complete
MKSVKSKIGLALGSGAARGWAHIGVIKALENENIPIHFISGSSVGSYVGAVYSGGGFESLKEFALSMDRKKVLSYIDVVFPRSGLLNGKNATKLYSMHTEIMGFDELPIPIKMVATDMDTGEKLILDEGNIPESIRASCSIPGIFTPVKMGNRWVIDGGLIDPVPVSVVKSMGADFVIAVDLNSGVINEQKKKKKENNNNPSEQRKAVARNEIVNQLFSKYDQAGKLMKNKLNSWFNQSESSPHIINIIGSAIGIMQAQITKNNLEIDCPDVLIQPQLAGVKMFDYDQAERSINEGYDRTMEKMETITKLLDNHV